MEGSLGHEEVLGLHGVQQDQYRVLDGSEGSHIQ